MQLVEITLEGTSVWIVSGVYSTASVIGSLSQIVPNDAILCLEGISIENEVMNLFLNNQIEPKYKIKLGTTWPKPKQFHLPMNKVVVDSLVSLADKHAQPELFDHLSVYCDGTVLLEAYDFGSDALMISESIDESLIQQFAKNLNCEYYRLKMQRAT